MMGVAMGFGKGELSLVNLIHIIDIALGDKEGCLSCNNLAIIRRILEGCYKERVDDSMNEDRDMKGEASNGSGSSSNKDNPNGGSIPLIGSS